MSVFQAATPTGNYPNMGAGYLARQNYINALTNKGWWKFAEYAIPSSLQNANRLTSAFILFNGINSSAASASGTIEFDLYYNTSSGYAIQGIYINNGSIDPDNVCAVVESDKISLYANLTANYYSYAFSIRSEWSQNGENASGTLSEYISFTSSFYGTTAPSGAVYAVVRNNASFAESAGYLANGTTISSGSSGAGWHKFMQVSNLNVSNGYSAILLVNGVLHTNDDTHSNSEHSGIIEIDYYNTYNTGATYYAVNVLAGNLTPEDFCLTVSGNSISIYKKFKQYQIVQFVQFSVVEKGADTVYMDELQSSAPSGAVYAVVRNNASADANGYSFDTNYVWHNNGQVEVNTLKDGTTSLDFNDYLEEGKYELHGNADNPVVNFPTSSLNMSGMNCDWYLVVYVRGSTYVTQVAYSVRADGAIAIRVLSADTWGAWRLLFDEGVAQSIPVASESVFGGAKMWVEGGKLYIKTE